MSLPELGSLEEVDLRKAWNHEAHSFTPWLAEHLDELAAKLGIELELVGTEVRVDTFSADILAQDPQNETQVLIENQLEQSDHSHLGQIMTYLAGLDAKTIIWVAKDFREPHLSALDWLNHNTDDAYSFFAVKVRAVRIGTSPIAPVFDVVARPNNWERKLQSIAKSTSSMPELSKKRLSFWTYYLEKYAEDEQYGVLSAGSTRRRRLDCIGMTVVSFISKDAVGVYVRQIKGNDPAELYEQLSLNESDLSELLGCELGELAGKFFFMSRKPSETSNQANWEALCDWLKNTADHYESILREHFA